MFTMTDFERVRSEKRSGSILDAILFSLEKNEFAYSMNLCNSHDRGSYAEKLLRDKLIDNGFDVDHCAEGGDFDLFINSGLRAEVKLATIQAANKSVQYTFHKIKPELFDVLFMVFLEPTGATIKWTTNEMVSEWSVDYKRGKDGYQIRFDGTKKCGKLVYNETLDGFVRIYSGLMTNLIGA